MSLYVRPFHRLVMGAPALQSFVIQQLLDQRADCRLHAVQSLLAQHVDSMAALTARGVAPKDGRNGRSPGACRETGNDVRRGRRPPSCRLGRVRPGRPIARGSEYWTRLGSSIANARFERLPHDPARIAGRDRADRGSCRGRCQRPLQFERADPVRGQGEGRHIGRRLLDLERVEDVGYQGAAVQRDGVERPNMQGFRAERGDPVAQRRNVSRHPLSQYLEVGVEVVGACREPDSLGVARHHPTRMSPDVQRGLHVEIGNQALRSAYAVFRDLA